MSAIAVSFAGNEMIPVYPKWAWTINHFSEETPDLDRRDVMMEQEMNFWIPWSWTVRL